jgi:sugar/nucleoside kinase (ribokinase family)
MKRSEKRKGIACGGNWIIDHVKVINTFPQEFTVTDIIDETKGGGGCAYNVVINLAKFDPHLPLTAVGMIGNDADGEYILNECRLYKNICLDHLKQTSDAHTSYTDVYSVKATGSRTFFHYRGANRLFSPESVDLEWLSADIFHLGYLLILDGMDAPDAQYQRASARFFAELKARGMRTSIDLVSADTPDFSDIVSPVLPYTDYCIVNDFEAEKLAGVCLRKKGKLVPENLSSAGEKIFNKGVRELLIIHFPEGAYSRTRDGQEIIQPSLLLPDGYIVGATGAGDAFCAGVLYGLYHHWTMEKTLRFAVCAGAQNLHDLTTTGAITHWKKIMDLEHQYPYRLNISI